jgi:hypothetical protein
MLFYEGIISKKALSVNILPDGVMVAQQTLTLLV